MRKGRSTLKSFSFFGDDSVMPVEFMEMMAPYKNMTICGVPMLDYTYDIYEAYLDGRVNKHTNIVAFVRGIQDNTIKLESKKQQKFKFIVNNTDDNEEESKDGVSQETLSSQEDKYEEFNNSEELIWAVKKIKSLKMELCVDFSINLETMIKKAALGFKPAKEALTELCNEVDFLADLVYIVLSSGIPIDKLFPEDPENRVKVS